jgi:hypothetical protein
VLRPCVEGVLGDFARMWRHQDIGPECERLGLPEPPPEGECSKRERVSHSLAALADDDLPAVAERIVTGPMPLSSGPAARFAIEDVLRGRSGAVWVSEEGWRAFHLPPPPDPEGHICRIQMFQLERDAQGRFDLIRRYVAADHLACVDGDRPA